LKSQGAHVELHCEHFKDDEDDPIWLPEVCQKGWVIISHDQFNELESRRLETLGGEHF